MSSNWKSVAAHKPENGLYADNGAACVNISTGNLAHRTAIAIV